MYAGQKVTLRPFTQEDSSLYLEWVNDEQIAGQVIRALPVTALEHGRWYESLVTRRDAVVFSVESLAERDYVGNVWLWGIDSIHRHAELRILIGRGQGKGYGTEACRLLLDFAFRRLNLEKVYLYVLSNNPRARRTFEKAGFREEGLLRREFFVAGEYRDAHRLGVLRQEFLD